MEVYAIIRESEVVLTTRGKSTKGRVQSAAGADARQLRYHRTFEKRPFILLIGQSVCNKKLDALSAGFFSETGTTTVKKT